MKPLVLAISLALILPVAASAQAPAPQAATAAPATPAWVEKSNADAQVLIAAQAKFQPASFSFFGIPGYDDKVADLGPDNGERFREAMAAAKATLEQKLQAEHDPTVRQALQIMIKTADEGTQVTPLPESPPPPIPYAPPRALPGRRSPPFEHTQN